VTREEWAELVAYLCGAALLGALLWRFPDLLAAAGAIPFPK